jgi:hypothetical protein
VAPATAKLTPLAKSAPLSMYGFTSDRFSAMAAIKGGKKSISGQFLTN